MNKPIFYFDKPSKWDLITVLLYAGLTVFIFLTDVPKKREWVFGYCIGTHLFIYSFNYKSLRKLNIWLTWLLFSLIHMYLYLEFVDDPDLQMLRGPAANGLQFTWLLLLLFQILRFISLKTQNQELVAPSKSRTDIWDDRKITNDDFVLFTVYMVATILLNLI